MVKRLQKNQANVDIIGVEFDTGNVTRLLIFDSSLYKR